MAGVGLDVRSEVVCLNTREVGCYGGGDGRKGGITGCEAVAAAEREIVC